jgi:uncharacterized protein YqgC (DUF456 family)
MSLDGSPAEQLFSYAVATMLFFSADFAEICFPAERLICSNFAELGSFFGVQLNLFIGTGPSSSRVPPFASPRQRDRHGRGA